MSAARPLSPKNRHSPARTERPFRAMNGLTHRSKICASFDQLVGAQQERFRHFQPQGPGGGQIDGQIELGRLLDRDIRRLRAAQNLVDQVGGAPVLAREVRSIRT
jgi:hypothetical protein